MGQSGTVPSGGNKRTAETRNEATPPSRIDDRSHTGHLSDHLSDRLSETQETENNDASATHTDGRSHTCHLSGTKDAENGDASATHANGQSHTGHLLGAGDIRRIASEAGISPTKKFGQNFVIDPGTVRRIVREAGVSADTKVLEVGPGLGSLTLALLESGASVTAVEIDPALAKRLPETVAEFMPEATDRLTIVTADAMSLSPETLPDFAPNNVCQPGRRHSAINTETNSDSSNNNGNSLANVKGNDATSKDASESETSTTGYNIGSAKSSASCPDTTSGSIGNPFTLVSNLPYNVATPILLTLLERFENLDHFLVMVQKEVADRLAAKPGSKIYGTPSVKLAWYGQAERVGLVGRNVFWPAPNVDSALVSFTRYDENANSKNETTSDADTKPGQNADKKSALQNSQSTDTTNRPTSPIRAQASREKVFQLIDAAFGQRRKTLHAALKKLVPAEAYAKAGIDPTRRGETLTIEEFASLAAVAAES